MKSSYNSAYEWTDMLRDMSFVLLQYRRFTARQTEQMDQQNCDSKSMRCITRSYYLSTYTNCNKNIVLLHLEQMWNTEFICFETRQFQMSVNKVQTSLSISNHELTTTVCTSRRVNTLAAKQYKSFLVTTDLVTVAKSPNYIFSDAVQLIYTVSKKPGSLRCFGIALPKQARQA